MDIKMSLFHLGTMLMKFELPVDLIDDMNKAYDKHREDMPSHNDQLAGKIAEENALDEFLDDDIRNMFMWCFRQYLKISANNNWDPFLKQVWVNEMRANEYNPIHFHTSTDTGVGLSSVLMLKRPSTYGKEATNENIPFNGRLEFMGGGQTQISIPQIRLDAKPGQFFVFPYSLMHGVYPFNGTDEVRRTLSCNCDLLLPSQLPKKSI